MPEQKSKMHYIVYDAGSPWKRSTDLVRDYQQVFKSLSTTPLGRADLALLSSLPSDSYDYIVGPWDGKGVTPDWLWKDCKALRVIFVSHETVLL